MYPLRQAQPQRCKATKGEATDSIMVDWNFKRVGNNMTPPVDQRKDVERIWREMCKNVHKHEGILLEMMRHPDVEPASLAACSATYRTMSAEVRDVQTKLRTKFPPRNSWSFNWEMT